MRGRGRGDWGPGPGPGPGPQRFGGPSMVCIWDEGPQMALHVVCSYAGVLGAPDGGGYFLEGIMLHRDECHLLRPGDQRTGLVGFGFELFP